jgi:hypothetical protein
MRYLLLPAADRAALFDRLTAMPDELAVAFDGVSDAASRTRAASDVFSPVEQAWHLADLEAEGFGTRIARLLTEDTPRLDDFDGDRVARERRYRERDLADGVAAFREARARTVAMLAAIPDEAWNRAGTQEGVGPLMLYDLPLMIAEHDAAHRAEIDAWRRAASHRPI